MRSTTAKRTSALLLATGLVFGLGACSDDADDDAATDDTTAPDDTGAPEETTDETDAPGDAAGSGALTISGFAFPGEVTAAGGDPVEVVNEDSAPHTVTSDDDAFAEVSVGGGETAELTAPSEPGEYPYHCEIHRSMTGTLVVP